MNIQQIAAAHGITVETARAIVAAAGRLAIEAVNHSPLTGLLSQ